MIRCSKCGPFLQVWLIFLGVTHPSKYHPIFQVETHFCTDDQFFKVWPIFYVWSVFLSGTRFFKCDPFFTVCNVFFTCDPFCQIWAIFLNVSHFVLIVTHFSTYMIRRERIFNCGVSRTLTTYQLKCFWHSVKQVHGVFYSYVRKATECCQNCPLGKNSAQLRKIKSSREVIRHALYCAGVHHERLLFLRVIRLPNATGFVQNCQWWKGK